MDVYNLILERGYIGALDYANKIEHKNLRLASEIDEIVSELFRIASGVKSIRTAQNVLTPYQRFKPVDQSGFASEMNSQNSQSGGSSIPSTGSDYTTTPPEGSGDPMGAASAAAVWASYKMKMNYILSSLFKVNKDYKDATRLMNAGEMRLYGFLREPDVKRILNSPDKGEKMAQLARELTIKGASKEEIKIIENYLRAKKAKQSLGLATKTAEAITKLSQDFTKWITKSPLPRNAQELGKLFEESNSILNKLPDGPLKTKLIDLAKDIQTKATAKAAAKAAGEAGEAAAKAAGEAGEAAAKAAGEAGEATAKAAGATEKATILSRILTAVGKKIPKLQIVADFFTKGWGKKILGPLALAIDIYDLYTDFQREGVSAKVVCKLVSSLLGAGSLITAAGGLASAAPTAGAGLLAGASASVVLGALWFVGSIGCNFIPSKTKQDANKNNYENLTKEKVNQAIGTASLEQLSNNDQNLVKDLFKNNSDSSSLINNIRNLRSQKAFEDPVNSLAVIQKKLNQGQMSVN